jgi:hypothetical protein
LTSLTTILGARASRPRGVGQSTIAIINQYYMLKEPWMTQTTMQPLEILASLGIDGTPTVTPVQGGFDMAIWKVKYEGQTYALRVFRPDRHEACERERVVMAAARAAGLPVPEAHRAGIWQNRSALLITWLSGRTVAGELRSRFSSGLACASSSWPGVSGTNAQEDA